MWKKAEPFLPWRARRILTAICYKILLSRTGRPDTDYIAAEMSYISTYAIHKAKTLEEELWSVVGVGDVIDISDEILLRYGVSAEQILAQQEKRRQFVASIEASD